MSLYIKNKNKPNLASNKCTPIIYLNIPILFLQVFIIIFSLFFRMKKSMYCDPFTHHYYFLQNVSLPIVFYMYNFSQPKYADYFPYTNPKIINKVEYYFEPYLLSFVRSQCYITQNANKADLFYIPLFFSMMMFTDGALPINNLIEKLEYWALHGGVDHIIVFNIFSFWRATIQEKDEYMLPCMLSFADVKWNIAERYPLLMMRYTILPYSSFFKLSRHYNINRNNLLFFIGSTLLSTFDETACELRSEILEFASNIPFSRIVIKERGKYTYDLTNGFAVERMMRDSIFCLVPLGDSPSSKRIYDALNALSIPIVVSDYIRFPFEDIFLNYSKILIQIPIHNYKNELPSILSNSNSQFIFRMQKNMRIASDFFLLRDKNIPQNSVFWAWGISQLAKLCYISTVMRRSLLKED